MHGLSIRRWSGLAVVLAIVCSPLATASPPPRPAAMARARAEVQALLAAQSAAWNRGDLPAFVAGYAADATFVSASGLTRGRQEVLARYRRRYPDRKAMGTLTLMIVEARPLGIDAASGAIDGLSVVGHWQLAYPGDPHAKPATGSTLLVLQRRAGRWEILQDASM
jgi:uncharacterized protein (TIGR02246 family)